MAEELEFTVKNNIGQIISGKVYLPVEISEPKPVAIFSHGYAANYKKVEARCIQFAEHGIPAISFDFRGGSEESKSDGKMSEMTIETEIMDLKCIIAFAKKLAIADHDKIFIVGESLGGLVTLLAAADKDVDVRGVALWYPALMLPEDSKKRLAEENNKFGEYEISAWFDEVSASIDIYKRIKGFKKPIIMFWGDKDKVVPYEYLERVVKECKNAKLEIINGQGHRFDEETARQVCQKCIEFVEQES